MDTIKNFYNIGAGPSSSHTMGPQKAARIFLKRGVNKSADHFEAELWGSLAATGHGHFTGEILEQTFAPHPTKIIWRPEYVHPYHPNGMELRSFNKEGEKLDSWIVFSVGGAALKEVGDPRETKSSLYPLTTLNDINEWCQKEHKSYWEYVAKAEGEEIWEFLDLVWTTMQECIARGLSKEDTLPGPLHYPRKAKKMLERSQKLSPTTKIKGLDDTARLCAYTLAVGEENASAGIVVTAPTCGGAAVLPGTLKYMQETYQVPDKEMHKALAVAGLFGNIVKDNACIAGSEAGCQSEVGVGCAMAGAAATFLLGGTNEQIEGAAESCLEHYLGLTCDPVQGYVQVPCIERNAVSAVRALNMAKYSILEEGNYKISFDTIVQTMLDTGRDMKAIYRETSQGGLAVHYRDRSC